METTENRKIYIGIVLAVLATLIWSGNFIIARSVINDIPPVTLAFYRWFSASIILLPFAWKHLKSQIGFIKARPVYFIAAAITGVATFNTFVYIAGHYSTAINMAILGTCSSPIISVILAAIFLKEKVSVLRIIGMIIMLAGILLLLSKGSWDVLLSFSFSRGDWWILAAAFTFAIYNVLAKRRPAEMHSAAFLISVFIIGTLILAPFYLMELNKRGGIAINIPNLSAILYLGLGASVICFLLWNISIKNLGAGRTALFGNLIPVFTSIEAVLILGEKITTIHLISFLLVIGGLMTANIYKKFTFSIFSFENKK